MVNIQENKISRSWDWKGSDTIIKNINNNDREVETLQKESNGNWITKMNRN